MNRTCPSCGADNGTGTGTFYCWNCGNQVVDNQILEVVHKDITFTRDAKRPSKLNFAGRSIDVPGSGITGLKAYRDAIIIECGDNKYRFVFTDVKDWSLMDISPQEALIPKREDAEAGPVRRKKS